MSNKYNKRELYKQRIMLLLFLIIRDNVDPYLGDFAKKKKRISRANNSTVERYYRRSIVTHTREQQCVVQNYINHELRDARQLHRLRALHRHNKRNAFEIEPRNSFPTSRSRLRFYANFRKSGNAGTYVALQKRQIVRIERTWSKRGKIMKGGGGRKMLEERRAGLCSNQIPILAARRPKRSLSKTRSYGYR